MREWASRGVRAGEEGGVKKPTDFRMTQLVLASSWPPRRDKMRYDADWQLHVLNLKRQALAGVPSVFS